MQMDLHEIINNTNKDETDHYENNETKFRSRKEVFKRKQKRAVSNLKGFGRKGIYGRGAQLDADQGSYFLKICDLLRDQFKSTEDKVILAENTMATCLGNEITYSSNQIACRVIENLIGYGSEEVFDSFLNEFNGNFRPICSDRFASHVFQKLVEISFLRAVAKLQYTDGVESSRKRQKFDVLNDIDYNLVTEFSEEHRIKCGEFVVNASNFLLNNLEDYVWDQYANHLIRSCLMNLIGVCAKKDNDQTNKDRFYKESEDVTCIVPETWNAIVIEYADRLLLWPQLAEFPYDEYSSGIIQCLVTALKKCDKTKLKSFGKKLIEVALCIPNEQSDLPKVFTSEPAVRLLETILKIAGNKLLNKITDSLFINRLVALSEMKSCNFAVQNLLNNIKEVSKFEIMFDELSSSLENLLKIGHTGVVLAMANACLRLKAKQAPFIKSLQIALHCGEIKEKLELFPLLVLKLKPYEIYLSDQSNFVHLHGSLILQAILGFNKPINIVMNMLNTKNEILFNIFSTPAGSRVADAFVQSKTIGDKSREKLIRHMQGTYLDLALSRNGSRAFEAFFNAAGDKQKEYLITELSKKAGLLSGTQSGKIISMKYHVQMFLTNPNRWKVELNSKKKVQSAFKDILN